MKSSEMKEETSETIKFKNVIDSINSEIKTDVRKELEGQKIVFFFLRAVANSFTQDVWFIN